MREISSRRKRKGRIVICGWGGRIVEWPGGKYCCCGTERGRTVGRRGGGGVILGGRWWIRGIDRGRNSERRGGGAKQQEEYQYEDFEEGKYDWKKIVERWRTAGGRVRCLSEEEKEKCNGRKMRRNDMSLEEAQQYKWEKERWLSLLGGGRVIVESIEGGQREMMIAVGRGGRLVGVGRNWDDEGQWWWWW